MLIGGLVTLCGLVGRRPEDGDSMFLQNVGNYLHVHAVLHPIRPTSLPQILHDFVYVDLLLHEEVEYATCWHRTILEKIIAEQVQNYLSFTEPECS
jgi:hypothetical protein